MDFSQRVRTYQHRGKTILLHDYSGLSSAEALEVLRHAANLVDKRGAGLNILSNVTDTEASKEAVEALQALGRKATPYVRKSAIVGITGVKLVLLKAARVVLGRPINTFDSVQEAEDWLAE